MTGDILIADINLLGTPGLSYNLHGSVSYISESFILNYLQIISTYMNWIDITDRVDTSESIAEKCAWL